jgi:protein O-mannosyl-transferase
VGNYHPLTMLSLALEYALVGDKPWLSHLNNLLLHSVNSYLLYVLAKKLEVKSFVVLILALFFAMHPMHVESR